MDFSAKTQQSFPLEKILILRYRQVNINLYV